MNRRTWGGNLLLCRRQFPARIALFLQRFRLTLEENSMKIVVLIARILVGLIFVVFGLNTFLHFIPTPPFPPGPVKDFTTVMAVTHYIEVVGFFQVLGGLLLFINRSVPLGLTILAP